MPFVVGVTESGREATIVQSVGVTLQTGRWESMFYTVLI